MTPDALPRRRSGPVLVTGATGNVGRPAVTALAAAGFAVRAGSISAPDRRTAGSPASGDPAAVETVRLDFTDPSTFGPALDGAAGLFLLRPPAISRVGATLNALVDEAARRGTPHVVFLSVAGAESNPVVPHHRVETHLRAADVPYTILRPGFFAQNLGDAYRQDIREDRRILVPAGDGRVAFIDTRDIADVVAAVFSDPVAHRGRGYTLTGPQAIGFDEVAARLSAHLDRPIRYEPTTALRFFLRRRQLGASIAQAFVVTTLHLGLRRGDAEEVYPTVERLLGRAPRTLDDYIRDHLERWG